MWWIAGAWATGAYAGSTCARTCESADDWARAARCLEGEGQWEAASEAWYRAWQWDSEIDGLGEALERILAHTVEPHLLELVPDDAPLKVRAWVALSASGDAWGVDDRVRAVELLESIGSESPLYAVAQARLGDVHTRAGRYSPAVMAYREATRFGDDRLADYGLIAVAGVYHRVDRDDNAAAYAQILRRGASPARPLAEALLAQIARSTGDRAAERKASRAAASGFVPEGWPLQILAAPDPRRAWAEAEPGWRAIRAALLAEPAGDEAVDAVADLERVWSAATWRAVAPIGDPWVDELIADHAAAVAPIAALLRRRAVEARVARIDAALAAAEACARGEPRLSWDLGFLDYAW